MYLRSLIESIICQQLYQLGQFFSKLINEWFKFHKNKKPWNDKWSIRCDMHPTS